jgi:hypothetical protein
VEQEPGSLDSGYRELFEVAKVLHRTPRTVSGWIKRFHLGPDHGVFHAPGGFLIHWPTFEREFVRKMDQFVEAEAATKPGRKLRAV